MAETAASAPTVPRWSAVPDHPLAEAMTIRDVMRKLLENREALKLGTAQVFLLNSTLPTLDAIIARGAMTPAERSSVVQAARIVLLMIH